MPTKQEQEYKIRILAEAANFVAGLNSSEKAISKFKDKFADLITVTADLEKAEQKLVKAKQQGNAEVIKGLEKEVAEKQKLKDKLIADSEKQLIIINRLVQAEEKATERVIQAANKKKQQVEKLAQQTEKDNEKRLQQELKNTEKLAKEQLRISEETRKRVKEATLAGTKEIAKGSTELFSELLERENPLKGFQEAFNGIGTAIKGLAPELSPLIAGIETVVAGGIKLTEVFATITKEAVESQKQIDQLTTTTGVSATNISALRIAAEQIGQTFLQVVGGIDKFAEKIKGASEGVKKDIFIFEKLKVNLNDASGNQRSLNDLLEESIIKFGKLEAGTDKAALGYRAFGLRAQKVIDQAAPSFELLRKKVEESGIVLGKLDADKLRKLSLDLVDIQSRLTGLRNIIGADFADAFSSIALAATQAFEAFKKDENLKRGLEVILDVAERLVQVFGNILVDLISKTATLIADFGIALDALPDSVKKVLGITEKFSKGLQDVNKNASQAIGTNEALIESNELLHKSTEVLSEDLKKLNKEQEIQNKRREDLAQQDRDTAKRNLEEGRINAEQYAERIKQIDQNLAEFKERNAQTQVTVVKNSIKEQEDILDNALANRSIKEADAFEELQNFQAQRVKTETDSANAIKNAEINAAKEIEQVKNNTGDVKRTEIAKQREIQRINDSLQAQKNANQQLLFDNQHTQEKLLEQTEIATEERLKAEEAIPKFKALTNLESFIDTEQYTDKELEIRNILAEKVNTLGKETAEKNQKNTENDVKISKAALDQKERDLKNAINTAKLDSEKALAEITETGVKAAEERGKAVLKPFEVEKKGYEDILKTANLTKEQKEDLENKLLAVKTKIADKEKDIAKDVAKEKEDLLKDEIKLLDESIAKRDKALKSFQDTQKSQIDEIIAKVESGELSKQEAFRQTLNIQLAGTRQALIAELQNLQDLQKEQDKGIDKTDEIAESNKKITGLQKEEIALQAAFTGKIDGSVESIKNLIDKLDKVPDKQKEANQEVKKGIETNDEYAARLEKSAERGESAAGKLKGGLISVGESADIASLSLDDLRVRIEEFSNSANFIEAFFAGPGKEAFVADIRDTVDKLNEELVNRTQRAAFENERKIAEEKERQARETAEKVAEINQNALDDRLEAEKEFNKEQKDLAEERKKENDDYNKDILDKTKKLFEDEDKLQEDFNKREKEIKDKVAEEDVERARQLSEKKQDIARAEADKLNDLLRSNLVDNAKLRKELGAQIEAEKDPEKKKELQKKLNDSILKNNEKANKEKAKQDEITALGSEKLSQEEYDARLAAINRRYDLEEEAQEQREELVKNGNAAELAEFDHLVAEQKKKDEERLAADLQRIKEAAIRKKEQAEKEREDRLTDYNQRFKDLQDAYAKEKAERDKQHEEDKKDLDKKQEEIKAKYKATLADIQKEQLAALATLGVSATAAGVSFTKAFTDGKDAAKAFNDELDKTKQKLADVGKGLSGDSSTSSSNTTNTASSTNTINNSSNTRQGGNAGIDPFGGGNQSNATINSNDSSSTSTSNKSQSSKSSSNKTSSSTTSSSSSSASSSSLSSASNAASSSAVPSSGIVKQGSDDAKNPGTPTKDGATTTTIPGNVAIAADFAKTIYELQSGYAKAFQHATKQKEKRRIYEQHLKLAEEITKKYITNSKTTADLGQIKIGLESILGEFSFNAANAKKFPTEGLRAAVEYLVKVVEAGRPAEGGKTKATQPTDKTISSDTPDLTGTEKTFDTGGGGTGGTKQPPQTPTTPNQPSSQPLDPKTAYGVGANTGYEGEGAEKKGYVLSGPNFSGKTAPTAEEALAGFGSRDVIEGRTPSQLAKANGSNTANGASGNNGVTATAKIDQGIVLQSGAIQVNAQATAEQVAIATNAQISQLIGNGSLIDAIKTQSDKQFQTNLLSRNGQNAIKLS